MKKNVLYLTLFLMLLSFLAGCSTKKNTARSRFYHSFTTRYNVYFNGSEAYKEGLKMVRTGNKDDYTEIIPYYEIGNKKTIGQGASNFDRTIEKSEKAVKLHSIRKKPIRKAGRLSDKKKLWLSQKEFNPFLYHAWLLMGRAQFWKGEYLEAASTFSYITRLYDTKPDVRAEARLWEAQSYAQLNWFYDAENILAQVKREGFPTSLQNEYDAANANYLLRQGRYKECLPYLARAVKTIRNHKQKARAYFLLGQVYQRVENREASYQAFQKVIRLAPLYQLEFNARIKQTEVYAGGNRSKMLSKLRRMTHDEKNKDYLDQVYYALGNIYMTSQDTLHAIDEYKKGVEKGTRSGLEKAQVLLSLGQIYWAKMRYAEAQSVYKNALGLIDKDYPDYENINNRSVILDDLTTYSTAVQLQDSLQHLATLSEADRLKVANKIVADLKKKEEKEKKEQELQAMKNQQGMNGITLKNKKDTATVAITGDKSWYFYNPQLISRGATTFQQQWGNCKLEDNWRRQNKTTLVMDAATGGDSIQNSTDSIQVSKDGKKISPLLDKLSNDIHSPYYYLKQIPLTAEDKQKSDDIIMDGLYNMGLIYKDKLGDERLTDQVFGRLDTQYPNYSKIDEVYFNLFLFKSKLNKSEEAEKYKLLLQRNCPKSKYTVMVSDPNYFYDLRFGKHLEDSLYAATFDAYRAGHYGDVLINAAMSAKRYSMGLNRPKFLFLDAMVRLQQGDIKEFMTELKQVIHDYPDNEITSLATGIAKGVQDGRLLAKDGSRFGSIWQRRQTDLGSDSLAADSSHIRFNADHNVHYLFLLAYQQGKVDRKQLLFEMARYNFSTFLVKSFDLSFQSIGVIDMMQTSDFSSLEEAVQYEHRLYQDKDMAAKLYGLRAVIISADNLELLKKYYSFDEYADFYKTHLSAVPSGNGTLDEPLKNLPPEKSTPQGEDQQEPEEDHNEIIN